MELGEFLGYWRNHFLVVCTNHRSLLNDPGFLDIIRSSSSLIIGSTFIMGLLWGIGGLTYGLGVRYLGVSLASSIILGLCSIFGAIIPSVYYYFNPKQGKDTISDSFIPHGAGLCGLDY